MSKSHFKAKLEAMQNDLQDQYKMLVLAELVHIFKILANFHEFLVTFQAFEQFFQAIAFNFFQFLGFDSPFNRWIYCFVENVGRYEHSLLF